ncbi:sugar nucleotide-binding protein, partial [Dolichospermum sp. ST_sed3]|nr:sugar nucleotide-binding protein [Dolichospermum sp. ST_sed3]
MKKLLLTGASGFLGWNICLSAQGEWVAHGVVHRGVKKIPSAFAHHCDIRDAAALKKLVREVAPHAVIHTAAISDANYCQQHAEETYSINVSATALLAEICAEMHIPFVFTSSDLVFDGKKGNYNETDEVNPLSKYGEQKAEAEKRVLKIYPEAAVCRMPLMIADGGGMGYLHSFVAKAKQGDQFKLFTDEFRSPLGGMSAAKGLLHAVQHFN